MRAVLADVETLVAGVIGCHPVAGKLVRLWMGTTVDLVIPHYAWWYFREFTRRPRFRDLTTEDERKAIIEATLLGSHSVLFAPDIDPLDTRACDDLVLRLAHATDAHFVISERRTISGFVAPERPRIVTAAAYLQLVEPTLLP